MPMIVDEVLAWYQVNLARYAVLGVICDLRPPRTIWKDQPDKSGTQHFKFGPNEMSIFLWDAGHLQTQIYRASENDIVDDYVHVSSGAEAIAVIEKILDEFASLPKGGRGLGNWRGE